MLRIPNAQTPNQISITEMTEIDLRRNQKLFQTWKFFGGDCTSAVCPIIHTQHGGQRSIVHARVGAVRTRSCGDARLRYVASAVALHNLCDGPNVLAIGAHTWLGQGDNAGAHTVSG